MTTTSQVSLNQATIKQVDINKSSKEARANILAKLSAQVAGADYNKLPAEPSFKAPQLTTEQMVSQFTQHLTDNHAQIIHTSQAEISNIIAKQLANRAITSLLCGTQTHIYSDEIAKLATSVNLKNFDFEVNNNSKEQLFNNYPAAVSSARCAIAATGSIVLWPDKDEPRTLSLVPPVHFVIVDVQTLYSDFTRLITEEQWQDKLPTNVVLISGPSKTADIQQTLAYGAHGPKELIVLLLNSEP